MGTFNKMFLLIFVVMMGACQKQAPQEKRPVNRKEITIIRIIGVQGVTYDCDITEDPEYDPQGFDEEF